VLSPVAGQHSLAWLILLIWQQKRQNFGIGFQRWLGSQYMTFWPLALINKGHVAIKMCNSQAKTWTTYQGFLLRHADLATLQSDQRAQAEHRHRQVFKTAMES
jgi:hypothetical protein